MFFNNIQKIEPILIKYIEDFTDCENKLNNTTKMIALISLDQELMKMLEKNPFYIAKSISEMNSRIEESVFEDLFIKFLKKYEEDKVSLKTEQVIIGKIECALSMVKRKLRIDVLKEIRLPKKDLFRYMYLKKLNLNLEENLSCNSQGKNKKKI
jgi:hypothetical protein